MDWSKWPVTINGDALWVKRSVEDTEGNQCAHHATERVFRMRNNTTQRAVSNAVTQLFHYASKTLISINRMTVVPHEDSSELRYCFQQHNLLRHVVVVYILAFSNSEAQTLEFVRNLRKHRCNG